MSSFRSVILAGGLAALAQAFTTPTTASWGPLLKPDLSNAVTQGQTFQVTWDPESHPTDGVTVSLVLCHGPSSNCQTASNAIVEGVPAAQKSYSWSVPCDLAAGTASTETGYGMLIIVDGTGEFQYSTQFSVLAGSSCGSSSSSASANSTSSSSASLLHAGGWTTAANGQSTYVSAGAWNTTTTGPSASTASLTISAPSSIVYATNSAAPGTVTSAVAGTTSYAVASPTAPSASTSASAFAGAAAKVNGQVTGVLGFVAGALAMLAL